MQVIRRINLEWTARLFQEREPVQILDKLLERYVRLSKDYGFTPVFAFLPQKNEFTQETTVEPFYMPFLNRSKQKDGLVTIDITAGLKEYQSKNGNVNDIYSENSDYGAHYNAKGNQLIANIIYQGLSSYQLLKGSHVKS